jgi:5-methylcytosine-specific restriction protein A
VPGLPKRACRGHGCAALVDSRDGWCDACRPEYRRAQDERRGSSRARGYDRAWEKVRALKVALNPLCERCEARGLVVPVAEVHHVVPIEDAPELRLDIGNLESLCLPCHRQETARSR